MVNVIIVIPMLRLMKIVIFIEAIKEYTNLKLFKKNILEFRALDSRLKASGSIPVIYSTFAVTLCKKMTVQECRPSEGTLSRWSREQEE